MATISELKQRLDTALTLEEFSSIQEEIARQEREAHLSANKVRVEMSEKMKAEYQAALATHKTNLAKIDDLYTRSTRLDERISKHVEQFILLAQERLDNAEEIQRLESVVQVSAKALKIQPPFPAHHPVALIGGALDVPWGMENQLPTIDELTGIWLQRTWDSIQEFGEAVKDWIIPHGHRGGTGSMDVGIRNIRIF